MKYARIIGDEVKDILSPVNGLTSHHPHALKVSSTTEAEPERHMQVNINSDSENRLTMDTVRSCRECGIGFKQVGFLSAEERIKAHERTTHSINCGECQDSFISLPHLRYHIETHHDARCGNVAHFVTRSAL